MMVSGVVEAPGGAAFTSCEPDYVRDEALQARYAEAARAPEALTAFLQDYLNAEPLS
jgi:glutaconate CoA-transferase subunit A